MINHSKILMISEKDNVAVALEQLRPGDLVKDSFGHVITIKAHIK